MTNGNVPHYRSRVFELPRCYLPHPSIEPILRRNSDGSSHVIEAYPIGFSKRLCRWRSRGLMWALILIPILAVPFLYGGTIIRAIMSASALVLQQRGAAKSVAYLSAPSYCAGVPEGLDEISHLTRSDDATRLFWIIRRFGGRVMSIGTQVEVLEAGTSITQVLDQETAWICYLPSHLLTHDKSGSPHPVGD